MAVTKRLAVWQLAATGLAVAIQAASGSASVFESGVGQLVAYAWLALTLATVAVAALKAYDNRQIKWLVAILFVWPLMYPYVFWYAHASRY